jgi:hypothetical protein
LLQRTSALIVIWLVLNAVVARADDDPPTRLYNMLAGTMASTSLRGLSTIELNPITPNASDRQAGMIGVASLKFTGRTPSTAEIRYAVFPREDQAN